MSSSHSQIDSHDPHTSDHESFESLIDHVRHVLPAQGPIGNFIHHNTLHAYQHESFHEAIAHACALSGAEGYLSEQRYRDAYREGRITDDDLEFALTRRARRLGSRWSEPLKPLEIERLILQHGLDVEPSAGLRFLVEERGLLEQFRAGVSPQKQRQIMEETKASIVAKNPAFYAAIGQPLTNASELLERFEQDPEAVATQCLFQVATQLVQKRESPADELFKRLGRDRTLRDALVFIGAPDPAEIINEWIVRYLSAYIDESVARWSMPHRSSGLLVAATEQLSNGLITRPGWQQRTYAVLRDRGAQTPQQMIEQALTKLGVERAFWPEYLSRMVLELPGWAGIISRLETHVEDRGSASPPVSLKEYIALRLTMEIECLHDSAKTLDHTGPLHTLGTTIARRRKQRAVKTAQLENADPHANTYSPQAYALFQLAQLGGISAPVLLKHQDSGVSAMLRIVEQFSSDSRRKTLHEAYENQHFRVITDAVADNLRDAAYPPSAKPRFQVMFCIDDREEAIRRHFEELDPRNITFGAAGFFGVAMEFTSLDDPRSNARCPIVVRPEHMVREVATDSDAGVFRRRQSRRAFAAKVRHEIYDGAGSLIRGIALAPVLGAVAASQLFARVLFPRAATHWLQKMNRWLVPSPRTQLTTAATPVTPAENDVDESPGALAAGFTEDERVSRVRGLLENIGLISNFAGIVVLLGHGASTVNNPHHSAYECGACGGRNGGPNARAFAAMANDPVVRAALKAHGIEIPDTTWFIGGWHDTTTDGITLFDTDDMPSTLRGEFQVLKSSLDKARARSAHERCRKFEHAPATLELDEALAHVEERAVDLSQARPELGHATNAVCVVGRRDLTRGLFLDRRSFLVSYDPQIDATGAIIERILAAIVPVGGGINLEYYFSTVDPERWGAGTKLPHNLAALIGVQDGVSGDLRTGLPRQMTEIHEPVRLLCIIEATPKTLAAVLEKRAEVREFVVNEWIRVVSVNPDTNEMQVFRDGAFHPVHTSQIHLAELPMSINGYAGQSGSIPPAKIRPSVAAAEGSR